MKFKTCKDCKENFRSLYSHPKYCEKCLKIRRDKQRTKSKTKPKILYIHLLERPIYKKKIKRRIRRIRQKMKYYYDNQDIKKVKYHPYLDSFEMFQLLESQMFRLYRDINCKYECKSNFCKITKEDINF